jgi:hypothetical protein
MFVTVPVLIKKADFLSKSRIKTNKEIRVIAKISGC